MDLRVSCSANYREAPSGHDGMDGMSTFVPRYSSRSAYPVSCCGITPTRNPPHHIHDKCLRFMPRRFLCLLPTRTSRCCNTRQREAAHASFSHLIPTAFVSARAQARRTAQKGVPMLLALALFTGSQEESWTSSHDGPRVRPRHG